MKKRRINHNGFTTIELIVVVLMISILSVTVLPKFFDSSGFEEYTYQAEVITKLRNIQLRAMQQTDGSQCHTVLVTETVIGIPSVCGSTSSSSWQGDVDGEPGTTTVKIVSKYGVVFDVSSGNYSITFDAMGRASCGSCTITILGESTVAIRIESEGYIHEG